MFDKKDTLMNKLLEKALDWADALYSESYYDGFCTAIAEFRCINAYDWEERIDTAFKSLLKNSCLKDRFKWKIQRKNLSTCYIIITTLQIYPRLGEKVDELMTILKMEEII